MSRATDAWDDEPAIATTVTSSSGSSTGFKHKFAKVAAVRDDWELDDEDEDVGRSVDVQNRKLWEDANSRESHPMPAVIMSKGASGISSNPPTLPLNQPPTMRILKRPSGPGTPSQLSTNSNTASNASLQDREARYQAARERIFGSPSNEEEANRKNNSNTLAKKPASAASSPPLQANKVVREPRGPNSYGVGDTVGKDEVVKGFGERKASRPPNSTMPQSSVLPSADTLV